MATLAARAWGGLSPADAAYPPVDAADAAPWYVNTPKSTYVDYQPLWCN